MRPKKAVDTTFDEIALLLANVQKEKDNLAALRNQMTSVQHEIDKKDTELLTWRNVCLMENATRSVREALKCNSLSKKLLGQSAHKRILFDSGCAYFTLTDPPSEHGEGEEPFSMVSRIGPRSPIITNHLCIVAPFDAGRAFPDFTQSTIDFCERSEDSICRVQWEKCSTHSFDENYLLRALLYLQTPETAIMFLESRSLQHDYFIGYVGK